MALTSVRTLQQAKRGGGAMGRYLLGVSEIGSQCETCLHRRTVTCERRMWWRCFVIMRKRGSAPSPPRSVGWDRLSFAGGIGENAPFVHPRICEGLSFLGFELNALRNAETAGVISTDASWVTGASFGRMKN